MRGRTRRGETRPFKISQGFLGGGVAEVKRAAIADGRVGDRFNILSTGARPASDGVDFAIDSGVAIAAFDGWSETLPCCSASAGNPFDLAVASGASCLDEIMVPDCIDGH